MKTIDFAGYISTIFIFPLDYNIEIGWIRMLGKAWRGICLFFSLSKNWLTYGVFWSLIPFGFLYICKWIVGYETDFIELAPDILLIVAAISANLLGSLADSSFQPKGIIVIRKISWSVMGLCWGIYLCLFTDFVAPDILKNFTVQGHPEVLRWGTRIALLIITVLGCVFKSMEYLANENKNNDDQSSPAEKRAAETTTTTK